jgi:hypothetical protein
MRQKLEEGNMVLCDQFIKMKLRIWGFLLTGENEKAISAAMD